MKTTGEGKIEITFKHSGKVVEVPFGTTAETLFGQLEVQDRPTLTSHPMVALVNNRQTCLSAPIVESAVVEYKDYSSYTGSCAYLRTVILLLCKVAEDLGLGPITIEHALSKGFYGLLKDGKLQPTIEQLGQLKERMQALISADLPIHIHEESHKKVGDYFAKKGKIATVGLLKYQRKNYYKLAEIGGYLDLLLEPILPRTGLVGAFDLSPLHKGFLLRVPDRQNLNTLYPNVAQPKQYQVLDDHLVLMNMLDIANIAHLNEVIKRGDSGKIVALSEAIQERKLAMIATEIVEKHREEGVRMVLLSGPSSSGKTTTSKRLATHLTINHVKPYAISLDDYYLNRADTPLTVEGRADYESLYALDLAQLQMDVATLIAGEEVCLPTYNFVTGEREYHEHNKIRLGDRDILIMEGIHALNPNLLKGVAETALYKVYVSALTSLSLDEHNWIRTSDNRMLRRIVRDIKYRGTSAEETILRWQEVRRGEEEWIFPFQEYADVMFNSFLFYEIPALKPQAVQTLIEVPENSDAYPTAYRLLKFLEHFEAINDTQIPANSLLREFIGGSSFRY